jgi:hypothetical protein
MLIKLPPQPRPIKEIEASFPNHWILIDQPTKDDRKEIATGILVMAHPSLDVVCKRCTELGLKKFAVLCTKRSPENVRFLL